MSQDSNHSTNHPADNRPVVSFASAFWVVIILVGVFICAFNFVKTMSKEGEEGKEGAKTEMAKPASEAGEMKSSASDAKTPNAPVAPAGKADTPQKEATH